MALKSDVMKILLVQTSFLGDLILSTPVIAAIKKIYPQSELWMMTTPLAKSLVENDPLLNGVIAFDKRGQFSGIFGLLKFAKVLRDHNFDLVFSLHKSARTSVLLYLAKIKQRIGFKQSKLSFFYTKTIQRIKAEHDVLRNLSLLSTHGQDYRGEIRLFVDPNLSLDKFNLKAGYIVIVPGSAWKTKMWSWQEFRKIAEHFLKQNRQVVVLGAKNEKSVCDLVSQGLNLENLAAKTSIAELMLIVKHASLVFCNDSMSLHLASGFKIPNVAIFCATSPEWGFGPWQNKAIVVEKQGLYCKPCRRHGTNSCPNGTQSCMNDLKAEEVLQVGSKIIAKGLAINV